MFALFIFEVTFYFYVRSKWQWRRSDFLSKSRTNVRPINWQLSITYFMFLFGPCIFLSIFVIFQTVKLIQRFFFYVRRLIDATDEQKINTWIYSRFASSLFCLNWKNGLAKLKVTFKRVWPGFTLSWKWSFFPTITTEMQREM